jgi:hypothetical protein
MHFRNNSQNPEKNKPISTTKTLLKEKEMLYFSRKNNVFFFFTVYCSSSIRIPIIFFAVFPSPNGLTQPFCPSTTSLAASRIRSEPVPANIFEFKSGVSVEKENFFAGLQIEGHLTCCR